MLERVKLQLDYCQVTAGLHPPGLLNGVSLVPATPHRSIAHAMPQILLPQHETDDAYHRHLATELRTPGMVIGPNDTVPAPAGQCWGNLCAD